MEVLKIQNTNHILEQIIESEENLLYTSHTYQKERKIVDRLRCRFLLSIGIPLLICIIVTLILTILAQFSTGILSEYSIFHSLLIIGLGVFIGYYLIDFIMDFIAMHRESLKNTEYFVTQRRIVSISTYKHAEYLIISVPFDKIHAYYIKTLIKEPIFHIYFKTEIMTDKEMNKCFQTAKKVSRVKDGIISGLDVSFKLPEKEFLLIWKNVGDEKIVELLTQYLPDKQTDITIFESGTMTIEAHLGL